MTKLREAKYLLPLVIFAIFILNLIQGANTQLLADEAYYWVYSQNMSWGYFDHPPMVALWIFISDFFFNHEIGVRFFSSVSYIGIIYLIWGTIQHPKKKQYTWLYLLLIFSTGLLNAYGFVTTPDTPLMFFLALFLWSYRRYLSEKKLLNYVFISISIAGLFYSKYQSVLIIFFVLLSNLKLVKDYKLWLAFLGSIIIYSPHLYWQWLNDFPSFRYHLYERVSVNSYKFRDTLNHFLNAVIIFGLTFFSIYKAFFKRFKTKDAFYRGLNFIIIGFFVFFFFSSFRGHVQPQWISPILFPLIIISFNYLIENKKDLKVFNYLAIINICIILFLRVVVANEGLIPYKTHFHGHKQWALKLKEKTEGYEKMFINRYQEPSIYWFYAQEKPHHLSIYLGRKNQYGLIPDNNQFQRDTIVKITRILDSLPKDYTFKKHNRNYLYATYIKSFNPNNKLRVSINSQEPIGFSSNKLNSFTVTFSNPYNREIHLDKHKFFIVFHNKVAEKTESIPLHKAIGIIPAKGTLVTLFEFDGRDLKILTEDYKKFGIGMQVTNKVKASSISSVYPFSIKKY